MAKKKNDTGIPQHEIDSLARALLPAFRNSLKPKKVEKSLNNGKLKKLNDNLIHN